MNKLPSLLLICLIIVGCSRDEPAPPPATDPAPSPDLAPIPSEQTQTILTEADILALIDPRLHPVKREIAPEDNAWPLLVKAAELFRKIDEQESETDHEPSPRPADEGDADDQITMRDIRMNYSPDDAWQLTPAERAVIESEITKHADSIRLLIEASKKSAIDISSEYDAEYTIAPPYHETLGTLKGQFDVILWQANLAIIDGDESKAIDLIIASLRVAELFSSHSAEYTIYLVSLGLLQHVLQHSVQPILSYHLLSDNGRRRLHSALLTSEQFTENISHAIRNEFWYVSVRLLRMKLDVINKLGPLLGPAQMIEDGAEEMDSIFTLGPDVVRLDEALADRYRERQKQITGTGVILFDLAVILKAGEKPHLELLLAVEQPWSHKEKPIAPIKTTEDILQEHSQQWLIDLSQELIDALPEQLNDQSKRAYQANWHNAIGKHFIDSGIFYTRNYTFYKIHSKAELEVTICRTMLALQGYEQRYKKLPDSLGLLVVDRQLSALPIDPFSPEGKPLLYNPKERLLWSVGANGADDNATGTPQSTEYNPDALDLIWVIPDLPQSENSTTH